MLKNRYNSLKKILVTVLLSFTFYICFSSPVYAQNELDSLRKVSSLNNKDGAEAAFLLARKYYNRTYGYSLNEDSTKRYLYIAIEKARKHQLDSLLGRCYFYEAKVLNREGKYEEAIESLKTTKQLFTALGDSDHVSKTQILFSYNYQDLGLFDKAIQHLEQAAERSRNSSDESLKANISLTLGTLFTATNNLEESVNYAKEAAAIYLTLKRPMEAAGAYNNMARAFSLKTEDDSAYTYFEKALALFEEVGHQNGKGLVYRNLANFFSQQQQYNRAIDYYLRSLSISQEIGDHRRSMMTHLDLASTYFENEQFSEAERHILLAENIAPELRVFDFDLKLDLLKSKVYAHNGEFEKALFYRNSYGHRQDSLARQDISDMMLKVDRKIQFLKEEDEKAILQMQLEAEKRQKELKQTRIFAILIIVVLLCLLVIIFFWFLNKKRQLEKKLLKQDLEQSEKYSKDLEQDINSKSKKLSSYAIQLIDKNQKIDQIKENIHSLREKSDDENIAHELSLLEKELEHTKNSEQSWEEFKLYFEEVHVNFFTDIKSKHPNLTNRELRLAALLRLNLSTKEIANLLNLPSKTIEVARYRLRKKLQLKQENNLVDYILSI